MELGVRFSPPSLLLKYEPNPGAVPRKFRKRAMPIRKLTVSSDCYSEAASLKRRHEAHLGAVPTVRIEKFLRLLQETMKGKGVKQALEDIRKDFSLNPEEDLNKLGDRELKRRKELMDMNFHKNQIKAGDPDFVYDKQVLQILSVRVIHVTYRHVTRSQ